MQGKVVLRDSKGNLIAEVDATGFPLSAECETFIGQRKFLIRYSYMDDPQKRGWKDRQRVKGLVMMKE